MSKDFGPLKFILLSRPGLVSEPDLYAAATYIRRTFDHIQAYEAAFLKASIAPATCAGWRRRADDRLSAVRRGLRLEVCFEIAVAYTSVSHRHRPIISQRTSCSAGVGPFSTAVASAWRRTSDRIDFGCPLLRSIRSCAPSAFSLKTSSQIICEVTPPVAAACVRAASFWMAARAKSRRV